MRLREAATALAASFSGDDVGFRGVSTDTRTLDPGQMFVAIRGPRFDAHELLADARRRGAAAAMIEREVADPLPRLRVADTRAALGDLAAHWRGKFRLPVIAVTGSNGKTTVKEMIATILGRSGDVLMTRGNLNNEIGVPLTVFGLGAEHRYGVIEMGANHPGEIARLCRMAHPTVAVITLCAPAHLEGFGTLEGVARAKGEIIAALPDDGIAVINCDDDYAPLWRDLAGRRRVVAFGFGADADVRARIDGAAATATRFRLTLPGGGGDVALPLPGRHNVMNALAAAACAHAVGIDGADIRAGLEAVRAVHGRLEIVRGRGGATVIDDTYNANPSSLAAALDVLAGYPGERRLVLGDMGELGAGAAAMHRQAGVLARQKGAHRVYALGDLARMAAQAFGGGGNHYGDLDGLLAAVVADLRPDVTVLVKGSRSMRMERVVAALAAGGGAPTEPAAEG